MKRTRPLAIGVGAITVLLAACSTGTSQPQTNDAKPVGIAPSAEFNIYWHQGKAELSHYALTQARYGELRNGDAVLVFVTEDLLDSAQVKFEGQGDAPQTSVLKLNRMDRFVTGIYEYSLMTSTFSPVDGTPPMKVSCTTQDWCGQMFMQLNRQAKGYRYELRSYFQADGDKNGTIGHADLEDHVMAQIRIDPRKLPSNTVDMLPTLSYLRLMHKPVQPVKVAATLTAQGDTSTYSMRFTSLDRTVSIHFGTAFPHVIFGWEETRPDGFGDKFAGGLTICWNDTWAYEVKIESYDMINAFDYIVRYSIALYDHFGLNIEDLTDHPERIALGGFKAWIVLQHIHNVRPFIATAAWENSITGRL